MKVEFTNIFPFRHIYINDLLNKPAIYSFWFKEVSQPLYIGKTEKLRRRMFEYYRGGHNLDLDMYLRIEKKRKFIRVKYFNCAMNLLVKKEEDYIFWLNPKFNKDKKRK